MHLKVRFAYFVIYYVLFSHTCFGSSEPSSGRAKRSRKRAGK